jgi:hypothetical protein
VISVVFCRARGEKVLVFTQENQAGIRRENKPMLLPKFPTSAPITLEPEQGGPFRQHSSEFKNVQLV